jgi:hypothetical protein
VPFREIRTAALAMPPSAGNRRFEILQTGALRRTETSMPRFAALTATGAAVPGSSGRARLETCRRRL